MDALSASVAALTISDPEEPVVQPPPSPTLSAVDRRYPDGQFPWGLDRAELALVLQDHLERNEGQSAFAYACFITDPETGQLHDSFCVVTYPNREAAGQVLLMLPHRLGRGDHGDIYAAIRLDLPPESAARAVKFAREPERIRVLEAERDMLVHLQAQQVYCVVGPGTARLYLERVDGRRCFAYSMLRCEHRSLWDFRGDLDPILIDGIAFELFRGLAQIHQNRVCLGNITAKKILWYGGRWVFAGIASAQRCDVASIDEAPDLDRFPALYRDVLYMRDEAHAEQLLAPANPFDQNDRQQQIDRLVTIWEKGDVACLALVILGVAARLNKMNGIIGCRREIADYPEDAGPMREAWLRARMPTIPMRLVDLLLKASDIRHEERPSAAEIAQQISRMR